MEASWMREAYLSVDLSSIHNPVTEPSVRAESDSEDNNNDVGMISTCVVRPTVIVASDEGLQSTREILTRVAIEQVDHLWNTRPWKEAMAFDELIVELLSRREVVCQTLCTWSRFLFTSESSLHCLPQDIRRVIATFVGIFSLHNERKQIHRKLISLTSPMTACARLHFYEAS